MTADIGPAGNAVDVISIVAATLFVLALLVRIWRPTEVVISTVLVCAGLAGLALGLMFLT
jgi:hypothetical protein